MISIPKNILTNECISHTTVVSDIISVKSEVLFLCLEYINETSQSKKDEFKLKLKNINGCEGIKIRTVNWFLKPSTRKTKNKKGITRTISSINKIDFFFKTENHRFNPKQKIINSLESQLKYFSSAKITLIISGLPKIIIAESNSYNTTFPHANNRRNQVKTLLKFLFDYDEFSKKDSIYSKNWGAYTLTEKLQIRSCLYCNRNYTITVTNDTKKIIRPELDHFFPKSEHPIIALSFYNLIPSCHICNSNLKGKKPFSLGKYFHPYLNSFEKENVRFTYKPINPVAFFNDNRGLVVKLDTTNVSRLKTQIMNNIGLFKLDEIYHEHQDIIHGLLELQRKTNKKRITDIYNNILVDSNNKKYSMSEKEIYELTIRNYFNEDEYNKKPMAKFERDIAKEIGLI